MRSIALLIISIHEPSIGFNLGCSMEWNSTFSTPSPISCKLALISFFIVPPEFFISENKTEILCILINKDSDFHYHKFFEINKEIGKEIIEKSYNNWVNNFSYYLDSREGDPHLRK